MTRRERIILQAGLVAAVIGLGAVRLAPTAVGGMISLADRVRLERELLVRREAELLLLPALEVRADSLRRAVVALSGLLLPGRTMAEAQTELLGRLETAASRAGGPLERAELVPDSLHIGTVDRVLARASLVSDLAGVLRLAHELEFSGSLLVVREMRIEADAGDGAQSGPERLRAEFVVEGWYLRREGGA